MTFQLVHFDVDGAAFDVANATSATTNGTAAAAAATNATGTVNATHVHAALGSDRSHNENETYVGDLAHRIARDERARRGGAGAARQKNSAEHTC